MLGEPRGEAPVRCAEPRFELALEGRDLAGHDQFELPRLVATVPVHLIAVQRLAALAARCECRPRFAHVRLPLKTCTPHFYSAMTLVTSSTRTDDRWCLGKGTRCMRVSQHSRAV